MHHTKEDLYFPHHQHENVKFLMSGFTLTFSSKNETRDDNDDENCSNENSQKSTSSSSSVTSSDNNLTYLWLECMNTCKLNYLNEIFTPENMKYRQCRLRESYTQLQLTVSCMMHNGTKMSWVISQMPTRTKWIFKSSRMSQCVVGQEISDVLKDHNAIIRVFLEYSTWRCKHYNPLKRVEILGQ